MKYNTVSIMEKDNGKEVITDYHNITVEFKKIIKEKGQKTWEVEDIILIKEKEKKTIKGKFTCKEIIIHNQNKTLKELTCKKHGE